MNDETKDLKEMIEAAGYDTREYSGRAMFGDSCLAFTLAQGTTELYAFGDILNETAADLGLCELLTKAMHNARVDSMGLGLVVYFPAFEYAEDDEDEDGPTHCPDCGANFDAGVEAGVVCPRCHRGIVTTGGASWFDRSRSDEGVLDLIIHELSHEYASNHLDEGFYKAATRLGAKTAILALTNPALFSDEVTR
jgi:hypothetical protein